MRESQSPDGSGRGGSGGSIEVFGRLRIMSPRRSSIHPAPPSAGGVDGEEPSGFSLAPQETQVSASVRLRFPHIGQR
jgi:hypothetical protein